MNISVESAERGVRTAELPETVVYGERAAYELIHVAGIGHFAEVWKAREHLSGRIVAVKRLLPEWRENRAARRLLENEAEVGRQISDPHVVRVRDASREASPPFVVLEWLEGESLAERLEKTPQLSPRAALWIVRQCAQGLQALAAAGYCHGDIKPANLWCTPPCGIKLIDLGFASALSQPGQRREGRPTVLTGTPEYLAPETVVPGSGDLLAKDQYSLGVLLYQLLTGRLPFAGDSVADVMRRQQSVIPTPLRAFAPTVSREVAQCAERLLSKQPLRRSSSWPSLVRELISLEIATL